jgi:nucleoside 2-deoxyribosyltransferase
MKKVFISFAIEDVKYRDFLVGQAKNEKSPFEFVDMSVKEPWKSDWKDRCRTKILSCDGMVALISQNTPNASGELFEVGCAYDEDIPVMLMYINDGRPILPTPLKGRTVNIWSWPNLKAFISRL